MKCLIHSVNKYKSAEKVLEKYPYFKICDYIKQRKIKEYFWSDPVEKRSAYKQLYIEGDANFIFEKLKEISDTIKNDMFILTFRDDGNIEAMIYDDYLE